VVCLLVIFGYWVSIKKSVFEGDFTFKSLGLVADSIHQCFRVGSELHGYQKRDAFVGLGASLVASARETGCISWQSGARFAGQGISFMQAIPVGSPGRLYCSPFPAHDLTP